MKRYSLILMLSLVAGAVAACAEDTTAPLGDTAVPLSQEIAYAEQAEALAQDEAAVRGGVAYHRWLQRLIAILLLTDNREAQEFLKQAREYHELARQALADGKVEEARDYYHKAFRAVLSAVLVIFPDAAVATGTAVDNAVARIETYLGDREAPRLRRILAHVKDLRAAAEAALALPEPDPVGALALNLRALHILHRLTHHIRDHVQDHDRDADAELNAIAY